MKKTLFLVISIFFIIACTKDDPITPPNNNPTVTLTVTVNSDAVTGSITATDVDGTVETKIVDLKQGGTIVQTKNLSGNTFNFVGVANGMYTVVATVTDNDGADGTASKSVTVNLAVETFTYTFNQTVNSIDENNASAVVIGSVNQTGTLAFTSHEFTAGGDKFELVGNDVRRKPNANHEASANDSFTLLLKHTGQTDVTLNGSVAINDLPSSNRKLCGGHDEFILNGEDNGTLFVLDNAAQPTSVTVDAYTTAIANSTYDAVGLSITSLISLITTDDALENSDGSDPLSQSTGTNGGITRVSDGAFINTDLIADSFGKLRIELIAKGYNYVDARSWQGEFASTTNPYDYVYRYAGILYGENLIKMDSGDLVASNTENVLDVLQKIDGITPTQALAKIQEYLAGNQGGNGPCD